MYFSKGSFINDVTPEGELRERSTKFENSGLKRAERGVKKLGKWGDVTYGWSLTPVATYLTGVNRVKMFYVEQFNHTKGKYSGQNPE